MISRNTLQLLLLSELEVDRVCDDVTTRLLGSQADRFCRVTIVAKAPGIFCGKAVLQAFQEIFPDSIQGVECLEDGAELKAGDSVVSFSSTVGRSLTIERTLLNTLTHLSGVATVTRKFVDAVKPFGTKILATRKTLPGLRDLQLSAVVAGGGFVHRRNLSDGILIKDNHVSIGGIEPLLKKADEIRSPLHRVEIEVQSLDQLEKALSVGADVIMLDNFGLSEMKLGIERIKAVARDRTKIEVSGGVNLESVRSIAELGVDYISVGLLTHSVIALNMSLDLSVTTQ